MMTRPGAHLGACDYWMPACAGMTMENVAATCFLSPPDRRLGFVDHVFRIVGELDEQLLDLLGRGDVDIEIDLLGVGEEILVLHGLQERLAQHSEPFLW